MTINSSGKSHALAVIRSIRVCGYCFLGSLLLPVCIAAQATSAAGPTSVVTKYINALQRPDFKTIVDLTYAYQRDVARIKSQNPQVLWPKLVAEYYDGKIAAFSRNPGYWENYTESVLRMSGDPAQNIRGAQVLLPPSCKWKITESRPERVNDFLNGGPIERTTLYIIVDYPDLPTAPQISGKFLRQTIITFSVDSKSPSVFSVARLEKGDAYWSKPYPAAAAPFLRDKYRSELLNERNPGNAIRDLLELGWNAAEPALLEKLKSHSGSFILAVPPLAEHRDLKAVPEITAILAGNFKGKVSEKGCDQNQQTLVAALGMIGSPLEGEPARALKAGLSNTLTNIILAQGSYDSSDVGCIRQYVQSLAKIDASDWNFFPIASGNKPAASQIADVFNDFERKQSASVYLDRKSPTIGNVVSYLSSLKPCDVMAGWRCLSDHIFQYLIVVGPAEIRLHGHVDEYQAVNYLNRQDGPVFDISMRLVKDASTPIPWLVTNVQATNIRNSSPEAESGSRGTNPNPAAPTPAPTGEPVQTGVACTDYTSCFNSGRSAFQSAQWTQSLTFFEKASSLKPSEPDVWAAIGAVDLALGRYQEVPALGDKALSLGGRLVIGVCHERSIGPCERGNLSLSPTEVSFTTLNGQKIFAVTPSQATASGTINYQMVHIAVRLHVANKNYNFDVLPFGVACEIITFVNCPDPGNQQQLIVSNYVSLTLPKLAAGNFSTPGNTKTPSTLNPPSSSRANSIPEANRVLAGRVETLIATSEKSGHFSSPLTGEERLAKVIDDANQVGVMPWLLFGQMEFETTFGNPVNATTRDGMIFIDGTSGNAHNLFNIRPGGSWTGRILDTGRGGRFRAYGSYEESIQDYLQLMSGSVYRGKSLQDVISTYFPANENGPARLQSYIDSIIKVAIELGFTADKNTVPISTK